MALAQFLISCGMNEKESEIYQALVRLGESTAQQVAHQTSRERTSTLRLMQSMVTKWRLGQTHHFHTNHFFAVPLDTLRHQFENSLREMNSLNDQYMSIDQEYEQLHASTVHDTMIKLYEWVSGIRVMYSTILHTIQTDWLIHIKCLYSATFESLYHSKEELSDEYEHFLSQLASYHVDVQSISGKGMGLIEDLTSSFGLDAVSEMPWASGAVQIWIVWHDLRFVITKKDPQIIHISSGPLANFLHAVVEKMK
jgi:hypothetical protein